VQKRNIVNLKIKMLPKFKIFKAIIFGMLAISFAGCGLNRGTGELTGVQGRAPWFHPEPLGMVYIPTGTFHTGQSDEDIFNSFITPNKQVSIVAFWMDDTEITNNEYRQFVNYTRDSIARYMLMEPYVVEDGGGVLRSDWDGDVDWEESAEDLEAMYLPANLRFRRGNKEINTGKLVYHYEWIDYNVAKNKKVTRQKDFKRIIRKEDVAVYPDTLCWVRDFAYSYNEPMTRNYFHHPKFDDYPVVGVNWHQANAFCNWRTRWKQQYWDRIGAPRTEDFRLPTEYEWEYAARGGRDNNMYPWGGPYTRNAKGCFLANFKPNRGNLIDDGAFYPVRADKYFPNDYGLYNMAGNVSEWTANSFTETSHSFTTDFNPDYRYDARPDKDGTNYLTLSRKVIRGGSWKDIAAFIQCGQRSYEYQDTTKSYVGFRTVQSYLGRSRNDRE